MDKIEIGNLIKTCEHKGVAFKDISPILASSEAFSSVIDMFAEELRDTDFDKIVVVESRGFLFGAALAYKMRVPLVMVRKIGKLPGECYTLDYSTEYSKDVLEIQKTALREGDRVVLCDDLISTGGTASACKELVRLAGANLVKSLFLIDLVEISASSRFVKEESDRMFVVINMKVTNDSSVVAKIIEFNQSDSCTL